MDVVTKTPLELAVDDLLTAVASVQSVQTATRFKTLLKRLENTLNDIKPILNDSMSLSQVLDHPEEETTKFIRKIDEGKEVVRKCSRIRFWNVHQNSVCSTKLIQLDKELLRFSHTELGNNTMNTANVIDPTRISNLDQQVSAVSSTDQARSNYSGSSSIPLRPNGIIGFDRHLEELKDRLLNDDNQVLVVSASENYGKTTLVKLLCHDKKIKDFFGKNILYVTISRQSSFEIVVQKLFEHYGENHPEFQTNEGARNQLGDMMRRHMGSDSMLLVLDHVGSNSVSIVHNLSFPLPGYKILVTSRSSVHNWHPISTYDLGLLNEEDARTLFCNSALPKDGIHINVPDDMVNEIVKLCKGLPLALTLVGASLCGQPLLKWETTLKKWSGPDDYSNAYNDIYSFYKPKIETLDKFPIVKECFLDLGSFPGDTQIAATALLDMWDELYNLDNEYMFAVDSLHKLSLKQLIELPIDLAPIRKEAGKLDECFHELHVTQHHLVRQLAIQLSIQEHFEERKRLFIEIHENQFPTWWIEQTVQPLNTQILSISTDETFNSHWYDLKAPKVEVLALNIYSEKYTLPQFIEKMDQLKVLSIMSHGHDYSQLHNLEVIGCLSNLKRVRFQGITVSSSIQPLFALPNLGKLSFVMCVVGDTLKMSCTNKSPMLLPNLTELEINRCGDLKELPSELCDLVQLKKLSITYCRQLKFLPKELGSLSNLENLRLLRCKKLQELPQSIGKLNKLGYLDTSDCRNIRVLPEEIGELSGLRWFKMSGCPKLHKLPASMSKLRKIRDVICDEEIAHLWTDIRSHLQCFQIHVPGNNSESMTKTTREKAPTVGEMVHDQRSSQTAGTHFSHHSSPSFSDLATPKISHASDGQDASEKAPTVGEMVHDQRSSQTAGTNFSHHSSPSFSDLANPKISHASDGQDGSYEASSNEYKVPDTGSSPARKSWLTTMTKQILNLQ